ncbi:MAG: PilN domain-containing protein [Candidatus Marinimicrobia bacterium]|jgi:Tfp pilus assembly protein PilN|nr:PilN domain-containing protein [Candidatus Neomarinimicrobiota bacterium]|tara:strand:- start:77 stop:793 length:717 start_codon:yes stop_codon:yes gene_type:complete
MKKLILINLNKSDTSETLAVRNKERIRWFLFGLFVSLLVGANGLAWYIGLNYSSLINQKNLEITQIKKEISLLREKGKNLSKKDIMTLANLENNRFLWSENLEKLGEMTPEDMSLTELKYKKNKLFIKGIATTYRGEKDFDQVERFINVLKSNDEFSSHFTRLRLMHHALINVRGQDIVAFELEAPLAAIPPISKQIRNAKFAAKVNGDSSVEPSLSSDKKKVKNHQKEPMEVPENES